MPESNDLNTNNQNLKQETKMGICKSLIRPILTYSVKITSEGKSKVSEMKV